MKESGDFPAFTGHCIDDGMLHIAMKKVKRLTSKDIQQIYDFLQKGSGGKKIYVLITFQGFIPMSDDAMVEAKRQGKNGFQAAGAYVVKNLALRIGIKFFLNFYKPRYPINILGTKAEAIAWLQKQKKAREREK